jgi:hypothetical protein
MMWRRTPTAQQLNASRKSMTVPFSFKLRQFADRHSHAGEISSSNIHTAMFGTRLILTYVNPPRRRTDKIIEKQAPVQRYQSQIDSSRLIVPSNRRWIRWLKMSESLRSRNLAPIRSVRNLKGASVPNHARLSRLSSGVTESAVRHAGHVDIPSFFICLTHSLPNLWRHVKT